MWCAGPTAILPIRKVSFACVLNVACALFPPPLHPQECSRLPWRHSWGTFDVRGRYFMVFEDEMCSLGTCCTLLHDTRSCFTELVRGSSVCAFLKAVWYLSAEFGVLEA